MVIFRPERRAFLFAAFNRLSLINEHYRDTVFDGVYKGTMRTDKTIIVFVNRYLTLTLRAGKYLKQLLVNGHRILRKFLTFFWKKESKIKKTNMGTKLYLPAKHMLPTKLKTKKETKIKKTNMGTKLYLPAKHTLSAKLKTKKETKIKKTNMGTKLYLPAKHMLPTKLKTKKETKIKKINMGTKSSLPAKHMLPTKLKAKKERGNERITA